MHDPQGAHRFHSQIIEFVGVCAAADEGEGFQAVDRVSGGVLFNEVFVAGLLNAGSDFVDSVVPGNVLPVGGAGPANLRLHQTPVVHNFLLQRGTLGAECAAVGRMIGVALDMDDLSGDILRAVADGVDDSAATHGAIRTSGAGLGGATDLQGAKLRIGGLQIEAENGCGCSPDCGNFQEVTA